MDRYGHNNKKKNKNEWKYHYSEKGAVVGGGSSCCPAFGYVWPCCRRRDGGLGQNRRQNNRSRVPTTVFGSRFGCRYSHDRIGYHSDIERGLTNATVNTKTKS